MRTMGSREIFSKKCRQKQNFESDLKGAWHYNHVTFTPIAKNFMLYCRLIYMLSILCVRLTIKVKTGIPENFKLGWYPPKKTGSSHLKSLPDHVYLCPMSACAFMQSSPNPICSKLLIFLLQRALFSFHLMSLYAIWDNLFSFLVKVNQN